MVGFDRAKALSKKKSPLSLQVTAVSFLGEFLRQISRWLHQRANRKLKPLGLDRKKENRIQKIEIESQKYFFVARGLAGRNSAVVL